MTYDESTAWLYSLQTFGIKLGLENMTRLLGTLDLALPEAAVVHVAGTNGKGSVCAMLDAIYRAEGHRCGLFTSPHGLSWDNEGNLIVQDWNVTGRVTKLKKR